MKPTTKAFIEHSKHFDEPTAEDRERVGRSISVATAGGAAVTVACGYKAAHVASGSPTSRVLIDAIAAPTAVGGIIVKTGLWAGWGVSKVALWLAAGLVGGAAGVGGMEVIEILSESLPPREEALGHFEIAKPDDSRPPIEPSLASRSTTLLKAPLEEEPMKKHTLPNARKLDTPATKQLDASVKRASPPEDVRRKSVSQSHDDEGHNLDDELTLIREAQLALGRNDPKRTLVLVRKHEIAFPRGLMMPERLAARAIAECALGRMEDARRTIEKFRQTNEHSPIGQRVAKECGLIP